MKDFADNGVYDATTTHAPGAAKPARSPGRTVTLRPSSTVPTSVHPSSS